MFDLALYAHCIPAEVARETVAAVIAVESKGDPLALNVNRPEGATHISPRSLPEAMAVVQEALTHGYSVDIGLMQVTSKTAARLGYSIDAMFDPCLNIKAGATVLQANYTSAAASRGPGQTALKEALSAYNTGDRERGFTNGYVAKYYGPAAEVTTNVPVYAPIGVDFDRPDEESPAQKVGDSTVETASSRTSAAPATDQSLSPGKNPPR